MNMNMNMNTMQGVGDIISLSETMEKTGIAVTVVAVFLFLVLMAVTAFISVTVKQTKNRDTQFEKMFNEVVSQNSQFTNNALKSQTVLLKPTIQNGAIIEEHLKYLYSKTKADRVAVYVFHNGQRMLNGNHILKFSCLNEYSLLDKFFFATYHKDTPISAISLACNSLLECGKFNCEDTSKIADPNLKSWFSRWGYKSVFVSAVFNTTGEVIGFVAVEYIDSTIYPDKVFVAETEARRMADKVTITIDSDIC